MGLAETRPASSPPAFCMRCPLERAPHKAGRSSSLNVWIPVPRTMLSDCLLAAFRRCNPSFVWFGWWVRISGLPYALSLASDRATQLPVKRFVCYRACWLCCQTACWPWSGDAIPHLFGVGIAFFERLNV